MKKGIATAVAALVAMLALGAVPTYAHDCFNPTKKPSAGVHYTITGFNEETGEPILEKTAQGKGVGGFVELSPELTGAPEPLEVHSIGNSESHETVGGPGSEKPEHACNGKGIDYLEACAPEEP